jgi:hypothetical protein
MAYETGAWLHATVYPQRCDLSPDGRWLAAFVLDPRADWTAGAAYVALSRLPWFTALAAWGIGSTWTSGVHFSADRSQYSLDAPDVGDDEPCRQRYGLAWTGAVAFAVERRRGWVETDDTPPRSDDDPWDVRRPVTMRKPCPADPERELQVTGWHAAFRAFGPTQFGPSSYWLVTGSRRVDLDGVQWAEWSLDGRLLVATTSGRLQARSSDGCRVEWEYDLATEEPSPTAPPRQAHEW